MSKAMMQKLAALGALGVVAVLVVLDVLFMLLTRYTGNGIDRTESAIAWISVGLIFVALIAVHIVYAGVLFAAARGKRFGV